MIGRSTRHGRATQHEQQAVHNQQIMRYTKANQKGEMQRIAHQEEGKKYHQNHGQQLTACPTKYLPPSTYMPTEETNYRSSQEEETCTPSVSKYKMF
jgi:hypothetical protein